MYCARWVGSWDAQRSRRDRDVFRRPLPPAPSSTIASLASSRNLFTGKLFSLHNWVKLENFIMESFLSSVAIFVACLSFGKILTVCFSLRMNYCVNLQLISEMMYSEEFKWSKCIHVRVLIDEIVCWLEIYLCVLTVLMWKLHKVPHENQTVHVHVLIRVHVYLCL